MGDKGTRAGCAAPVKEASAAEWENFRHEAHRLRENALARATAELQKEQANDRIRRLLREFKRELEE